MSERLVPDLAGAVLDGTPIDWAGAESSADDASRPVLAELRVLAALADVHRRLPLHDQTAPPTGDRGDTLAHWGHLRALERIGRGVFGEVYRAWDTRLDREVALKLIDADPASSEGSSSSVIHEGRLLARVRHPNVVTIYGAEQIGTRIGLWMEFVRGRTLKQIVDDGKVFSGAEAVQIGVDVARAVAAVHSAGVLHRDIKSQNVMLADDGRAVLMDFGTGRELADNGSDVAGTPLYLAPEILAGGDATVQSDIYSLGILLYYLVTGSYPVRAETVSDLRLAHQRNERIPIRTARSGSNLSPKLARIIERAIDPRPNNRYARADTLAADLATLQPRPTLARLPYAIAAATVILLIVGLGWEAIGRRAGSSRIPGRLFAGMAGWNADTAGHVIPSTPIIAVMPFRDLSVEPDSEYFVDGLTEEVIRNLSVLDGLTVRSSYSSFTFKNRPRDVREAGRQLNVDYVLEASVLRAGTQLRIIPKLVHAADNVVIWSEKYDKELKDIFAIQDEISLAIVNQLRLKLGRGRRPYETNVEAYDLYLKGLALVGRGDYRNLEKAVGFFQQALAKDATYAPAHAGLATAYAHLLLTPAPPNPGDRLQFETAQPIIRAAARKAIDLDPLLADAYAAMGCALSGEFDWAGAEKAFQRAIDLNPSLSQTYISYSFLTLQPLERHDESLRLLRVALENVPLSLELQRLIGVVQVDAGRYEEAIDTLQRVRAVEPDFPFVDSSIARALTLAGRPAEALPLFERSDRRSGRPRRDPFLALAYVMLDRRAEAEALAAEHQDGNPGSQAVIYAALGDTERAFDALERLAVNEPQRMVRLLTRGLAGLRGDPRMAALRKRFNLP